MRFFSQILRYLHQRIKNFSSKLRIFRLKLLYPDLQIDLSTQIGRNCTIKCIKGGKIIISKCEINDGCHIVADCEGTIIIHSTHIGMYSVIVAKESITINKGCLIAEMVVIRDQDHIIDIDSKNMNRQLFKHSPINIGQNVWIASKATILKGVTIGNYSIIAASSVVNRNIPPLQIWGGIPCKFINYINKTSF